PQVDRHPGGGAGVTDRVDIVAAVEHVVVGTTIDQIVAGTGVNRIGSRAGAHGIVAGRGGDRVIAAACGDDEGLDRRVGDSTLPGEPSVEAAVVDIRIRPAVIVDVAGRASEV